MPNALTEDRKMKDLISRVGEDISQLRGDISSLFTHTGRHTLPESARELREQARERLHASGAFAVSQFRQHPGRSSVGLLGGLFLLAAVGIGIHYLCKGDCGMCCSRDRDCSEEDELDPV